MIIFSDCSPIDRDFKKLHSEQTTVGFAKGVFPTLVLLLKTELAPLVLIILFHSQEYSHFNMMG